MIQIGKRGIHELGELGVLLIRSRYQRRLAAAFSGKAGAPGVRHPDLNGSQPCGTQGVPALLDAF
jgi:hypothetical protein